MQLVEKFQTGAITRTYQRIDKEYKVNIFIGYNPDGQMSMVITEKGKNEKVKSSKLIDVNLNKREDGKMALSFDLLDNSYESMFVVFCKDIILICEQAGREMAISNALVRWKYWKEMFGRRRNTFLDKNEIKGLIGELLELKNHFIPKIGVDNAISSWMGPLFGHKDFEVSNTWFEVKTVNEAAVQVTISSMEQLEAETEGHLVIIRLEDTSPLTKGAINLNKLVLEIMDEIEDPETLEKFRIKLDNVGYEESSFYDEICFLHKATERYVVNENFPRIRRKEVNDAIGNAKYSILFNGIMDYKEE